MLILILVVVRDGSMRTAAAAPATRATLRVDFGPHEQRLATGWTEWSENRDQVFSTAFDADFELEIDANHAWRDRGEDPDDAEAVGTGTEEEKQDNEDHVGTGPDADPLWNVLRDGLRERDDRDVRLTFKRLDPGHYVLELFSCDMGERTRAAVGHFDVVIDGEVVLTHQSTMGRSSLAGAALPPLTLTSRGEPIHVVLARRDGDLWLNGFALSAVITPESG